MHRLGPTEFGRSLKPGPGFLQRGPGPCLCLCSPPDVSFKPRSTPKDSPSPGLPPSTPASESESSFVAAGTETWEEATRRDGVGSGARCPGLVEVTRGCGGGSFASLASVGLGPLRPIPAGWKTWGRGHPLFPAGRGLMGPPQGVCRVRLSPLPAAPPWRGGGAELPRAGAGRAPRVRGEDRRGVRPGWGCHPALLRSARSGTAKVWVLAACQGAPGLLSAFERVELPTPGSPVRARFLGLVLCPARLFVSCEPRKPP